MRPELENKLRENLQTIDFAISQAKSLVNNESKIRSKILKYFTGFLSASALLFAFYQGYNTYSVVRDSKNREYATNYLKLESEFSNKRYHEAYEDSIVLISNLENAVLFPNKDVLSRTKNLRESAKRELIKSELKRLNFLKTMFSDIKKLTTDENYNPAKTGLTKLVEELSAGVSPEHQNLLKEVRQYETDILDSRINETKGLITSINIELLASSTNIITKSDPYKLLNLSSECIELYNKLEGRKFPEAVSLRAKLLDNSGKLEEVIKDMAQHTYVTYLDKGLAINDLAGQKKYKDAQSLARELELNIKTGKEKGFISAKYLEEEKLVRLEKLPELVQGKIREIELSRLEDVKKIFSTAKEDANNGVYDRAARITSDIKKELIKGVTNESNGLLLEADTYDSRILYPKIKEFNNLVAPLQKDLKKYSDVLVSNDVCEMIKLHRHCNEWIRKLNNSKFDQATDLRKQADGYANRFKKEISLIARQKADNYLKVPTIMATLTKQGKYEESMSLKSRTDAELEKDRATGLFSEEYFKQEVKQ